MATIIGQKRGKTATLNGGDGNISYSTTITYIIYDDTGLLSEAAILTTAGLPVINTPLTLPDVPFNVACKSKQAQQWESNNKYWTVTCELDNQLFQTSSGGGGGDKETDSTDPTTWIPLYDLSFEQDEEICWTDTNGIAIVNFARRRYDTALTRKRLITCLRFVQYEPAYLSSNQIIGYHESVNKTPFFGQPKWSWMLEIVDADLGFRNGIYCWRVEMMIKLKKRFCNDLWIYNGGYQRYTDGGHHWQPAIPQIDTHDKDGKPLTDGKDNQFADFLNENGTALFANGATRAFPYFLIHEIYPEQEFNGFLRITPNGE